MVFVVSGSGRSMTTGKPRGVRERVLDAAEARALEVGLSALRVGQVAERAGVSRQTVYNEFGAKDKLAEAVVLREMGRFVDGIVVQFDRTTDLAAAVGYALEYVLESGAEHPVLRRMVAEARSGTTATTLPMLTMNADLLLIPLRTMLGEACRQRWELEQPLLDLNLDMVIRASISHLVMPSDLPRADVVHHLVRLAVGTFGEIAPIDRSADSLTPQTGQVPSPRAPGRNRRGAGSGS